MELYTKNQKVSKPPGNFCAQTREKGTFNHSDWKLHEKEGDFNLKLMWKSEDMY